MNTTSDTVPPADTANAAIATAAATKPIAVPASSFSAQVNMSQGKTLAMPKTLTRFNTRELATDKAWFHCCLYSEFGARKSTTAAIFGSPEDVRIIQTRRREQLMPLRDMGYEAVVAEDESALSFALMYPEKVWPEWAGRPERTLVLDDATEGVAMLLEGSETIDGKEVKDPRRTYGEAGKQLRSLIKLSLRKPQHFILVSLARVRETPLGEGSVEERIGPDLPPSMLNLVLTEFEYVFYIKTGNHKLLTQPDSFAVTEQDEKGKAVTYRRGIFAKNKLPLEIARKMPPVLQQEEVLDLAAVWSKIKSATSATSSATSKVKK